MKWKNGLATLSATALLMGGIAGVLPTAAQDTTPPAAQTLGDVNGDGTVDTGDARLLLQAAAELVDLSSEQGFLGDVNGDGMVDTGDARLALQYAAEMDVALGTYTAIEPENVELLLGAPMVSTTLGDAARITTVEAWTAYCDTVNTQLANRALLSLDAARYDKAFFEQHQLLIQPVEDVSSLPEGIRLHALWDNGSYVQPIWVRSGTLLGKSSALMAITLPKDAVLSNTIHPQTGEWALSPSATEGAPVLSTYNLNDPYLLDSMPTAGKTYFLQQADTKEALTAAVAQLKETVGQSGWDAEFDACLAAHDAAYFETGSVVLALCAEPYRVFSVKELVAQEDGSWTLNLNGIDLSGSISATPRPHLLLLDIHQKDLGGHAVTAAKTVDFVDVNGYLPAK